METLLRYREEEFRSLIERYTYLNHAATSPLPHRTQKAVEAFLADRAAHGSIHEDRWWKVLEETRTLAARLIGATPDEIAFIKSTTEGLHFVVHGLDFRPGDNVVLIRGEFPANLYPWFPLSEQGVEIRFAEPQATAFLEEIARLVDARTRVLAVTWVDYLTGRRLPLRTLAEIAHRRGAFLSVDAIQGLGALTLDVREAEVDFLMAGGPKWLLSPLSTGIFFVRQEHLEHLRLRLMGWLSVRDFLNFSRLNLTPREGARRFEYATYNLPGIHGMHASLSLLLEADPRAIEARVLKLSGLLLQALLERGYRPLTPEALDRRAGIVTFRPRKDPAALKEALAQHGIIVSLREGHLRVSPHFYNTEEELSHFLETLEQLDR